MKKPAPEIAKLVLADGLIIRGVECGREEIARIRAAVSEFWTETGAAEYATIETFEEYEALIAQWTPPLVARMGLREKPNVPYVTVFDPNDEDVWKK